MYNGNSSSTHGEQPLPTNHGQPVPPLLDYEALRSVQTTAANILVEAFASGTLSSLNDELLRRRTESHLGWSHQALDSPQACVVVAQTRCLVLTHINAAAKSATIRFAILGVALEPIRHYLQS